MSKQKPSTEPKTYAIRVECSNCEHQGEIQLPKGTEASGKHECPNCGCETATKIKARLPAVPTIPMPRPARPKPDRIPFPSPWPYQVPPLDRDRRLPWKKSDWISSGGDKSSIIVGMPVTIPIRGYMSAN